MIKAKFRGWRPSTQEWVYGYLIERKQAKYDQIVQPTDDKGMIVYDVEKGSTGQFTGLYDVDNNEIYEGDCLVRVDLTDIGWGVVGYEAPSFEITAFLINYTDEVDEFIRNRFINKNASLLKIVTNEFELQKRLTKYK